mmetsp:Transcript_46550/g.59818  ORF Transcript_46550/g.59818 Transcript_46550/m.59818 type:complete len:84 (-) Transcript_46550:485-736(-)
MALGFNRMKRLIQNWIASIKKHGKIALQYIVNPLKPITDAKKKRDQRNLMKLPSSKTKISFPSTKKKMSLPKSKTNLPKAPKF